MRNRLFGLLLCVVCVMGFVGVAFAGDFIDTSTWVTTGWDLLWQTIYIVISYLIIKLLKKYGKRIGLEIDEIAEAKIREVIDSAISYTEEAARHSLKIEGIVMTSIEKEKLCIDTVLSKIPGINIIEVKHRILERLPAVRQWISEGALTAVSSWVAKGEDDTKVDGDTPVPD